MGIPQEENFPDIDRTKYGHKNPTAEEQELRRLNMLINELVNEEDRQICIRVQQGLQTNGYEPGPLSQQESCIFNFHDASSYDANRILCQSPICPPSINKNQVRVIFGNGNAEPNEGKDRIRKPVFPPQVPVDFAVLPVEIHPDVEKLVDTQSGHVVDFKPVCS